MRPPVLSVLFARYYYLETAELVTTCYCLLTLIVCGVAGCSFQLVVCADAHNAAHDLPSTAPLHSERGMVDNTAKSLTAAGAGDDAAKGGTVGASSAAADWEGSARRAERARGPSLTATVHPTALSEGLVPWDRVRVSDSSSRGRAMNDVGSEGADDSDRGDVFISPIVDIRLPALSVSVFSESSIFR